VEHKKEPVRDIYVRSKVSLIYLENEEAIFKFLKAYIFLFFVTSNVLSIFNLNYMYYTFNLN